MRALLRRNFRQHARMLALCALGLATFEVVLALAAVRIEQTPEVHALIERILPPFARQLATGPLSLLSFAGGLAFGFAHPVVLAICGGVVVAAATLPAAERESGLLELVLARPVARTAYLLAVEALIAAGAIVLPLALVAGAVIGTAIAAPAAPPEWTRFLWPAGELCPLLFAIGNLGLAFAASARRRGTAVACTASVFATAFVIDVLADLWPPAGAVRFLSPFRYYRPLPAVTQGVMPVTDPVVLALLAAIAGVIAFASFARADLD